MHEQQYSIIVRVVFEPASAVQSPTSFLTSFLRCHKNNANLPWYFGHAWATPSKTMISTCKRLLMFISMQNTNFITQFFLQILQRYCILVILSTLHKPGHAHQKLYKTLMLIYTKIQLNPPLFLEISHRFHKLNILGNLGMPGHVQQD